MSDHNLQSISSTDDQGFVNNPRCSIMQVPTKAGNGFGMRLVLLCGIERQGAIVYGCVNNPLVRFGVVKVGAVSLHLKDREVAMRLSLDLLVSSQLPVFPLCSKTTAGDNQGVVEAGNCKTKVE